MLNFFRNIPASERKSVAAGLLFILAAWLLFFLAVPPFENPDEDNNYAYVQSLASGNYPVLTHGETPDKATSVIGAQLRVAYKAFETRYNQERIFNSQHRTIDDTKSDYVETSTQAYHPPLYFATAALFYWLARNAGLSSLAVFYVTKLAGLFFYLIFIANVWLFLRTVMKGREAGYLTLGVAIQPTLLMMASGINPEIGAIAFFTLVFSLLVISLKNESVNMTLAVLLGFLSAVAILTKVTNAILLPLTLTGFVVCLTAKRQKKFLLALAYLAAAAVPVTPWLIFNLVQYGTLLPHNLMLFSPDGSIINVFFASQTDALNVITMTLQDLKNSVLSIPGVFGWADAPMFLELRVVYTLAVSLLIATGIWQFLRYGLRQVKSRPEHFLATVALLLLSAFLIAYSVMMKLKFQWIGGLQGHYFLIGLLPATILFYTGIERMVRLKDQVSLARHIFYGSLIILLVGILYSLLPRFYV